MTVTYTEMVEIECLSTDTKPTTGISSGSFLKEITKATTPTGEDIGRRYIYLGATTGWKELVAAGDFKKALDFSLDGSDADSVVRAGGSVTTSGNDWLKLQVDDYRTLTSSQEYRAGYFRYNVRSTTPGAPQTEVTGCEGVGGVYIADGNLLSLRGGHFRTYVNADATSSAKTMVGCEMSARASYSGGTECVALSGTCFTGARIYMAPYYTSATLANINNFWGLWIYGEHATQRNADSAIKISDAGGGFTADITFQGASTLTDDGTSLTLAGAGFVIGTAATGLDFTGTYTGNVIDFSNATIAPTGSNGPCFIRAGTYAAPIDLGTDVDQSGMIRLYCTSSATSTSYDRGLFVCLQSTVTKCIYPVAGLAEVRNVSGNGPIAVGAAQFISHLFLSTSKVDARSAVGLANFYGGWFKCASEVSSEAKSGSVVAPIWLDTQMNGTVNGEMYAAFITTGHHNDAVFGLEETGGGGHWHYLFSFDDTTYDQLPCGSIRATPNQTATCDGSLAVNLNGTVLYIPLYNAITVS